MNFSKKNQEFKKANKRVVSKTIKLTLVLIVLTVNYAQAQQKENQTTIKKSY